MFGVLTIPNLSFDSVTKNDIHDIHRESQYINDDTCQIMSLSIFSTFHFSVSAMRISTFFLILSLKPSFQASDISI